MYIIILNSPFNSNHLQISYVLKVVNMYPIGKLILHVHMNHHCLKLNLFRRNKIFSEDTKLE